MGRRTKYDQFKPNSTCMTLTWKNEPCMGVDRIVPLVLVVVDQSR